MNLAWFSRKNRNRPPAPETRDKRLPPELMAKIRLIQARANHLASNLMAGEYVSAFKGRGMEFTQVREYQSGDDVRFIDWNVTARMGHPFIKEYREEREMTLMLMVDVSSSNIFGSSGKSKTETAAITASVLACLAIKNNDKVGLIVFSDKIEHHIRPKKGRAHVWNLIRTILNFRPEGRRTRLEEPLRHLMLIQKRKCTAFLISDFQAENYAEALKLAGQNHDLIAVRIRDPREDEFPRATGYVHLRDAETGDDVLVNTGDRAFARRFSAHQAALREQHRRQLLSLGADVVDIRTDQSVVTPLMRYFKARERRR